MTTFKIINDDNAVRGLQEVNKHPVTTAETQKTRPARAVEKSPGQQLFLKKNRLPIDYKHRQQQDRRQHTQDVLIDTRSESDRRKKNSESEQEGDSIHHVDELV